MLAPVLLAPFAVRFRGSAPHGPASGNRYGDVLIVGSMAPTSMEIDAVGITGSSAMGDGSFYVEKRE